MLARSAGTSLGQLPLGGRASAPRAPVDGLPERKAAVEAFTERLIPGRLREIRAPTLKEVRRSGVLALALGEASAKIRTGPPLDDEQDYALPTWAGVVPIHTLAGVPVPDARLADGIEPSEAVNGWTPQRASNNGRVSTFVTTPALGTTPGHPPGTKNPA